MKKLNESFLAWLRGQQHGHNDMNLIFFILCLVLNSDGPIFTSFEFQVALADLRTNSKVGPLVPYFLNLVALSVNKLQRNGRLTDALLRTVEALVDNPYVDPSSQLAVSMNKILLAELR